MSSQARILRRAYTGKLSLKTTDHCRTTSLLANFSPSSTRISPARKKLENGLFLCELENILSPQECAEIIKNGDECIFQDMSDKYRFGKQRNSSRLLALDQTLAANLWQNIEPVLSKEMEELEISQQPLGFDVTRGEWELHGLNEAMRLNKYSAEKKEFFGPHKDAQYCPSGDERSLFTLIVYLNADIHGGETCFYLPKDITQSTKGMTTQEEIDALGGLKKGFSCVKIVPEVGHAVLFSQNILHEALPVLKGTKYILKTDVVVKRHSKQFGFAVEEKEKDDYLTCLNYFREAQQQELQGNFEDASDLYERALSIRYCYPKSLLATSTDSVIKSEDQSGYMLLPLEVWQHVFQYLSGHDVQNLVYAYPVLNVEKHRWEQHQRNNASSLFDQKFLPKIDYQKGIVTRFEFPDADFFRENACGCSRVAAMYSFFLLGHKPEEDVYTVRYNPDTQDVCAVALETLLTDVYYGRRCYGSFYSVRQQDSKIKNPEKDFEASVDRNYMSFRHGAQFVGVELPDSFYIKSTVHLTSDDESEDEDEEQFLYQVSDDEFEEEEQDVDEIERGEGREEINHCEEKVVDQEKDEICDGTIPIYCFGRLEHHQHSMLDSLMRNSKVIETDFRSIHEELFSIVYPEENDPGDKFFLKALDYLNEHAVSCTLVSKLQKQIRIHSDSVCLCGPNLDGIFAEKVAESCTTEFYNHLVFDFKTSQLSVMCCDNKAGQSAQEVLHPSHFEFISEEQSLLGCVGEAMFYKVNIEPILSPDTSFNHAACQCTHPRFDVHEYYNMKDYPYLDHIHLVAREMDGKMLVWTVYGGVVSM